MVLSHDSNISSELEGSVPICKLSSMKKSQALNSQIMESRK